MVVLLLSQCNDTLLAIIATTGPPTLQNFSTVYYVIAGDLFTLNCTATNDPQSNVKLRFKWKKESARIDSNPQWNITKPSSPIKILTLTSQLIITNLTVEQHNGTYTCSVDNYRDGPTVDQIITVVVESKSSYFINDYIIASV